MKYLFIIFSISVYANTISNDEEIIKDLEFFQNFDLVKENEIFIKKEITKKDNKVVKQATTENTDVKKGDK